MVAHDFDFFSQAGFAGGEEVVHPAGAAGAARAAGAGEKFYKTSFPAPAQDSALAGYPHPASLSASPRSGEAGGEVWVAGTGR